MGDVIYVNFKKWKRFDRKKKMTPNEFTCSVLGHLIPENDKEDEPEPPKGA